MEPSASPANMYCSISRSFSDPSGNATTDAGGRARPVEPVVLPCGYGWTGRSEASDGLERTVHTVSPGKRDHGANWVCHEIPLAPSEYVGHTACICRDDSWLYCDAMAFCSDDCPVPVVWVPVPPGVERRLDSGVTAEGRIGQTVRKVRSGPVDGVTTAAKSPLI